MNKEAIHNIVEKQKQYFEKGYTQDINMRIYYLKRIKEYITENESKITAALKEDLGKSPYESYLCEIAVVIAEVNYMLGHIKKLTKSRTVMTPFGQQLSHSYIRPKPYGTGL